MYPAALFDTRFSVITSQVPLTHEIASNVLKRSSGEQDAESREAEVKEKKDEMRRARRLERTYSRDKRYASRS